MTGTVPRSGRRPRRRQPSSSSSRDGDGDVGRAAGSDSGSGSWARSRSSSRERPTRSKRGRPKGKKSAARLRKELKAAAGRTPTRIEHRPPKVSPQDAFQQYPCLHIGCTRSFTAAKARRQHMLFSAHDCASECDFCRVIATFDTLLSGRSRTRGVVGSSTPIRGASLSLPSSSSESDEVGDDGDLMHLSNAAAASTLVVGFVRTLLDPTQASILSGRSRIRVALLSWMISRIGNKGDMRSVSTLLELPKRRVSRAVVRPDDARPVDAEFRPRPRALQSKLAETFKKLVDWINRELPVRVVHSEYCLGLKRGSSFSTKRKSPYHSRRLSL